MQDKFQEGIALTFDDVLLVPAYSEVLPKDIDVKTQLTNRITLNIPLMSAAMDTVTEASLAIALARQGGIGVIHRNLSIEKQAEEVKKVKRSESVKITDPYTLFPDDTVTKALDLMTRYNISGLLVVEGKKLVGIVTRRDLPNGNTPNVKISKVMTKKDHLITALPDITAEEAASIFHQKKIEKLPLINKKGYLKGLITAKDLRKIRQFPNACKDSQGRLRVGAAIGVFEEVMTRAKALVSAGVDFLVVDTAHGHSQKVLEITRWVKEKFGHQIDVITGNIATGEAAQALIEAGADAIKVGVGPGSICTTRVISGAGMPQITAIADCAKVAKEKQIPVIADGGVRFSGDITKAIAAGADVVMIGSLFAGTDESPGELIYYQGRQFKIYRGMGSMEAMREGEVCDRYFQEGASSKLVPEGIEGRIPYRGPLANVVFQLIGGLKAGMGYCGAKNIPELQKAKFVQITASGMRESHPHNVIITKEAPNYQLVASDNEEGR